MKMIRITLEGKSYEVGVELLDAVGTTSAPAPAFVAPAAVAPVVAAPAPVATVAPAPAAVAVAGAQSIVSPMPGVVFKIRVAVGQQVAKEEELIVLEAMKMESPIYAPCAGTVSSIFVKEADSVNEGQVLIQLS